MILKIILRSTKEDLWEETKQFSNCDEEDNNYDVFEQATKFNNEFTFTGDLRKLIIFEWVDYCKSSRELSLILIGGQKSR